MGGVGQLEREERHAKGRPRQHVALTVRSPRVEKGCGCHVLYCMRTLFGQQVGGWMGLKGQGGRAEDTKPMAATAAPHNPAAAVDNLLGRGRWPCSDSGRAKPRASPLTLGANSGPTQASTGHPTSLAHYTATHACRHGAASQARLCHALLSQAAGRPAGLPGGPARTCPAGTLERVGEEARPLGPLPRLLGGHVRHVGLQEPEVLHTGSMSHDVSSPG